MSELEGLYNFILVFEPMVKDEYKKVPKVKKKKLPYFLFAIAYYAQFSNEEKKHIQNLIETI